MAMLSLKADALLTSGSAVITDMLNLYVYIQSAIFRHIYNKYGHMDIKKYCARIITIFTCYSFGSTKIHCVFVP